MNFWWTPGTKGLSNSRSLFTFWSTFRIEIFNFIKINITDVMSWKTIKSFSSTKVQPSDRIIPSEIVITYFQKSELTYSNMLQKISIFQVKKNKIPCRRILIILFWGLFIAWKVSKYGVFSVPYFPVFGLKYGLEKTPYLDGHFSRNYR